MTTGTSGGGRSTEQNRTEGRQEGKRERIWANCTGRQGTRVSLGGGRGGVPEPYFEDGESNNLNIKGQSLVIL